MKKITFLIPLFILLSFPSLGFSKTLRFGEILCKDNHYHCIEIQEGDTWDSLWPDPLQQGLIKKINRFANRLRKGMKVVLPQILETATLLNSAPFPSQIDTAGKKEVIVDLNILAWGAYNSEGQLVNWGPASGGKAWCPDVGYECRTPSDTFHFLRKGKASCKSSKFPIPKGGAPMPYCMHFYDGYALHGSYDLPGYNASHGCVRLMPEDAKWLNENFVELPNKENAFEGTEVIIKDYTDPQVEKTESKP